jgi:hypothetical protein
LVCVLVRTVADPDLWGHVRFGLDILESGQISRVDPYSYLTSGMPWINHEWLSEVMYAWAYLRGGTPGIVLLKAALGRLLFLLLSRHLRSAGLRPIRAWIVVFIGFALSPGPSSRPTELHIPAFAMLLLPPDGG